MKWRIQTRDDHRVVQRVLLDFLGDKPVGDVTKTDLLSWIKMARMIPMKRGAEFKGMTIPAVVQVTLNQDRPRIADKTINARYISWLGGCSKSGSQRSRTYAADHTILAKAALIKRLKFI